MVVTVRTESASRAGPKNGTAKPGSVAKCNSSIHTLVQSRRNANAQRLSNSRRHAWVLIGFKPVFPRPAGESGYGNESQRDGVCAARTNARPTSRRARRLHDDRGRRADFVYRQGRLVAQSRALVLPGQRRARVLHDEDGRARRRRAHDRRLERDRGADPRGEPDQAPSAAVQRAARATTSASHI